MASSFSFANADIKLDFEIIYLDCNLADESIESRPVLRTYLGSQFERTEKNGGIITTHLDEHDLGKIYEGTLTGNVNKASSIIPITSSICFAQYAMRRNEFGFASMTHAGTANVQLYDVIQSLNKGKPFETTLPLIMEPSKLISEQPISKGAIKFKVLNMNVSKKVQFLPVDQCILGAPIESMSSLISDFIDDRIRFEASMKDTWNGIKNVRAPMDISSTGIQSTKTCFLPVESLVIGQPFQVNATFYENAMKTIMKRKGLNHIDVEFKEFDIGHKAELMAEICCYVVQSLDYISDTIETSSRKQSVSPTSQYDPSSKKPWEDMGNSLEIPGDCEDGSNGIKTMFNGFRNIKFDPKIHKELIELQNIASDYTYFSTLATVHGAKAEDQTEHIGAHMYGLLIPNNNVKQMLSRNKQGAAYVEKIDLTQKNQNLPVLVAEGTGMLRPLGSSKSDTAPIRAGDILKEHVNDGLIGTSANQPMSYDPLFLERKFISKNMYSKQGLKTLIPRDMGAPSSFYLGQLLGVTDKWLAHTNVGAFIFGNITENNEITRGAFFTDIINQNPNVALIPCLPVPEKIMQIAYEANALRAPLRSYELDLSKPIEGGPEKQPAFEKMKQTINKLGRKGVAPFGSVDVFIKPHQFTAKSIENMTENLVNTPNVFKLEYNREIFSNEEIGYRIQIFVDHSSMSNFQQQ